MWRPLRNSSYRMDFAKHNLVQMMLFSLHRNQAKKHGGDRLFLFLINILRSPFMLPSHFTKQNHFLIKMDISFEIPAFQKIL